MKERTPEQLKGQVRSFAAKRGLMPQEVLQMFFLERVLERLSRSNYSRNFILKGGMLISSMLGVMERTTMDMDTTVNGISMAEDEIAKIIKEILKIDIGDGITFEFENFPDRRFW
ncbi:nucleotidyl transferase AbiEii/AbiGii toxin family protein [Butyrivibrio sp. INlla21]|uniref:nucleotidyl transferase AbiEii/AbiGii toxin family protein n=1 Tax=Butyrivibrio sp. INlla21 TaxID=1520811 RepID=UPI0008E9DC32|nr:nucleotidyl transferase AbiEii/AbiGii toxin family protein [Butyrivibrio sp. INlla21]SFU78508.1 Nucleotidyl transferase AbiEii toxin, Type IV TA system [Butyrivibrio sp. INlla21]